MIPATVRILLLTLVWVALQGSFGVGNLILGVLIAIAVDRLAQPVFQSREGPSVHLGENLLIAVQRVWWSAVLLLVFLRELVESATQVAWYTIQPRLRIRPGVVAYPLDVQSDLEITTLANLISLTPGTLSLDVAADRSHLYVHAISVRTEDGSEVIQGIKSTLERSVSRALGPRGTTPSVSVAQPPGEEPTAEGGTAESVEEGRE